MRIRLTQPQYIPAYQPGADLSEQDLQALVDLWRWRLRIDVDVRVQLLRWSDMKRHGQDYGSITYNLPRRTATMRVLHTADCRQHLGEANDYEFTLVHELLHLPYAMLGVSDQGTTGILLEQIIDDQAAALVAGYRGLKMPAAA